MIRVVVDTNVIVSALLQILGSPAAVFLLVADGAIQMCVSGNIYAEYEEVIRRPRLARAEEVITATLQTIREKGLWVKPTETIKACSDPDDDIFLECADAGRADYLVTPHDLNFRVSPESAPRQRFNELRSGESLGSRSCSTATASIRQRVVKYDKMANMRR